MKISDATGTGLEAKVDINNRVHTNSLTIREQSQAAENGDAFNLNTGDVTLTTANESGVMYLKNNEDRDLVLSTIVYLFGTSTGGTGDTVINVCQGASAGTLVSNATPIVSNSNKNFGNSKTLDIDIFKGTEGSTITDGSVAFSSRLPAGKFPYLINTGDIVIPKGSSIAIAVTPQASNTSMIIQVAFAVHLRPTI